MLIICLYTCDDVLYFAVVFKAGTELVPELQTHAPNWFPPEKVIFLGIAKLVPV
jgi:hypothetical protein